MHISELFGNIFVLDQCQIIFLGKIFLSFLAVDFFWASGRLCFLGEPFCWSFLAVDFFSLDQW